MRQWATRERVTGYHVGNRQADEQDHEAGRYDEHHRIDEAMLDSSTKKSTASTVWATATTSATAMSRLPRCAFDRTNVSAAKIMSAIDQVPIERVELDRRAREGRILPAEDPEREPGEHGHAGGDIDRVEARREIIDGEEDLGARLGKLGEVVGPLRARCRRECARHTR